MSLYEEKEAKLTEAFTHLIQDSSDEEEEQKFNPSAVTGATATTKDCKVTDLSDVGQPITEAKNQIIEEIGIIDDDDDCEIIHDDGDFDDDVEILDSQAQSKLSTSRITHDIFTPEKKRYSSATVTPQKWDLNRSCDDDEFQLKLIFSGKYKQIATTYKTKLCVALESLISELKLRSKSLVITDSSDNYISLDESPYSLNLTPGSLLNAIEITPSPENQNTTTTAPEEIIDPDMISVKLQDGHRKHMKEYMINKSDPIVRLKELWSKEYGLDVKTIKLCFDGDILSDGATSDDFEIDDGCVIDVMVAQN